MSEGGKEAVRADEDVVAASEVRRLEERVRDLERLLGRKTMEVEILKEALDLARVKNRPCCRGRTHRRIPREADRQGPRAAGSNLVERAAGKRPKRGPQTRAGDAELTADIRRLVDTRPSYGYRRIAALLKRSGEPPATILSTPSGFTGREEDGLLLAWHTARRVLRAHDEPS